VEILIPVDQSELSDPDLIENLVVTREEYDAPSSNKRKKKEEIQELDNTSKETITESIGKGGDDEVENKEGEY